MRTASDLVDIHILGFFQAEDPHHQADPSHQHRVPQPVEDAVLPNYMARRELHTSVRLRVVWDYLLALCEAEQSELLAQ